MRKIESNPFGLFPRADEKPLHENLFHLLALYDILLEQAIASVPEERKAEFDAAHKLIDNQRQAYRQNHQPKPRRK